MQPHVHCVYEALVTDGGEPLITWYNKSNVLDLILFKMEGKFRAFDYSRSGIIIALLDDKCSALLVWFSSSLDILVIL